MKSCEVVSPEDMPVIQPNVFAWLDDTNALMFACQMNKEEKIRILLEKGFTIRPMAVLFAAAKARETKSAAILELLVHYGWDINRPPKESAASLMS